MLGVGDVAAVVLAVLLGGRGEGGVGRQHPLLRGRGRAAVGRGGQQSPAGLVRYKTETQDINSLLEKL